MADFPPRPPSPRPSPTGLLLRVDLGPRFDHRLYLGPSGGVTDGGVFVATKGVAAIGTVLDVSLVLPDDNPPVTARAVVRWHKLDRGSVGMGARFVLLSEESRHRLERHAEEHGALAVG